MRTNWTGVGTALVTPFTQSGDLDEAAVRRLGRRQIDAGIHFLVPCGTTGESPTLTDAERVRVVEILVDEAAGEVPVLAGAGGYNTREVIAAGRRDAAGRRLRPPVGDALLQQADAGRSVPALPRDCREHAAADHSLQRAGPDRRQHRNARRCCGSPRFRTSSASRKRRATSRRCARSCRACPRISSCCRATMRSRCR